MSARAAKWFTGGMPTPAAIYRRPLFRWIAAGILLCGMAAAGWREWRESRCWVGTDNAYLDGPVHPVAARIIGTVERVEAEENQAVNAGDVLVRLDPRDAETRRRQTAADLAEAEAGIAAAAADVTHAEAGVRLAEAELAGARLDLDRRQRLEEKQGGAISRQDLEHAECAVDTALAALDAARGKLESARTGVVSAKAKREASAASHRQAELQCEYTTITAPVSGKIGRRNVETGQPVIPSQPLLAVVGNDLWLTANFKETQVGEIRPGQAAVIRFDLLPGRDWQGVVESVSPATGSRFALLPPDNATGNFTRVVQRVPVRIRLSADPLHPFPAMLGPGLSAKVKVRVEPSVR